MKNFKNKQGFTLIELLIVIAIIAILAAIIYVAIDPARRLSEARDADRWASANATLNAILKYTVDSRGVLPNGVVTSTPGVAYMIGSDNIGCDTECNATTTQAQCLDIGLDVVDEYIASMPIDHDPEVTFTPGKTGYYIVKTANGRLTVGSCNPEQAAAIAVTR